jgi:hypothetical protein
MELEQLTGGNMVAQACRFKRAEKHKWESGIMIGTDKDETVLIVDIEGKVVIGSIWTYNLIPHAGCFRFREEDV